MIGYGDTGRALGAMGQGNSDMQAIVKAVKAFFWRMKERHLREEADEVKKVIRRCDEEIALAEFAKNRACAHYERVTAELRRHNDQRP